ncbi:hypothetical protein [Sodalis-like endosymbiont of Proechinophthirus fluctus]|uniref:hypothetical protein n=1 Tax=Sodalis-like endosymbiont of Proechinophthirus fluctus TaxID=1462730 RepID=UPI000B2769D1|nr:hypothetical protein [Sodalis-like endosymbiont of Proechinophthirus fluctus]
MQDGKTLTQGDKAKAVGKQDKRLAFVVDIPIDTADFAVLAITVIVSLLGAGKLIART